MPLLWAYTSLLAQSTCDITGPTQVCAGDVSVYHLTVQSQQSYTIQWTAANGEVMTSNDEMAMIHWTAAGATSVVARILLAGSPSTPLGSCILNVDVLAQPSPMFTPNFLPTAPCRAVIPLGLAAPDTGYCSNTPVVFSATNNNSPVVWTVTGNAVASPPVGNAITVQTGSGAGTFEVCITEVNALGCSTTYCKTYNVFAPPVAGVAEITFGSQNPIQVCAGEDLIFQGNYSDPDNLEQGGWFWEVRDASNAVVGLGADENLGFTFGQPGTYTVSLVVTNCLGCQSAPAEVTVQVDSASIPVIICPSVVCQSATPVEYCTTADCGAYTWQVTGGTIQGASDGPCVDIVWDMPVQGGYGFVTLNTGNCQGNVCPLPTTVEVPVIPAVQTIDGPAQLCDPNSNGVVYSVPFWPGAVYSWSFPEILPGSTGSIGVAGGNTNNDFEIVLTNFSGSFRLRVQVTHPVTNCVSEGELVVEVRDYRIQGVSVCYGQDAHLSVSPAVSPTPYSIKWKLNGSAWQQTVQDASDVSIPFSAFGGAGVFEVSAEIMFNGANMFTCAELVAVVTVNEPVEPITDVSGPKRVCPNVPYLYSAVPAVPPTLHWWATGGALNPATGPTTKVTWQTGSSAYLLSVVREDADGCRSDTFHLPVAGIGLDTLVVKGPDTICVDAEETYSVFLGTDLFEGADSLVWSIVSSPADGSIISGNGTPSITVRWHNQGPVTVRLQAWVCGNLQVINFPVFVRTANVEIFCETTDCKVCQGTQTFFFASGPSGARYTWTVDGATQQTGTQTFYPHTFSTPGTHFVGVTIDSIPGCPGSAEDIVPVDVIPNPEPIITQSAILFCNNLTPITLNATTYPGADSETFSWIPSHNPPVYTEVPVGGPQLVINSTDVQDYTRFFSVTAKRTIDGKECYAYSDYLLTCDSMIPPPNPSGDVIFTDWTFNRDLPSPLLSCTDPDANACGVIIVSGDLNGRDFGEVSEARWRVFDPQNGLNPVDVFPIFDNPDLQATEIATFSKAGFYPTQLEVAFIEAPAVFYTDQRVLQVPLVPAIQWAYRCSDSAGMWELTLRDVSEAVPTANIFDRTWVVGVNGGAPVTLADHSKLVTLLVPSGSEVSVSLTPFTRTVGNDNPDSVYFCTECITIDLPAAPALDIAVSRDTNCVGTPVQFSAILTPNADDVISYDWNFNDGSGSQSANTVKTFNGSGSYMIDLTVKTDVGCVLYDTVMVEVVPNLLKGTIDTMLMACQATAGLMYLPNAGTPSPTQWAWSPGGQTSEAIEVMESGVYDVTVSDGYGCTFSPPAELLLLPNLFSGGIAGDLAACQGKNLQFSINGTSGFSYLWSSDIPGFQQNAGDDTRASAPSPTAGSYSVWVTALSGTDSCASVSASVQIWPLPAAPMVDVNYNCDPFFALLSTNPLHPVSWRFQNNFLGIQQSITALEGGQYTATERNGFGCEAKTNTTVADPIDVNILSGCYEICDTALENGDICLEGPSGTYSHWAWLLLPSMVLGSGSGSVQDLCLTQNMVGEIVLQVEQNYINTNPSDTVSCAGTSEPFCLEQIECTSCPDLNSSFNTPTLIPLQCDTAYEQVVKIIANISVPDGYEYCGYLPEFTGAHFELMTPVENYGVFIRITGFIYVTDPQALEDGLQGVIRWCHEGTGEVCPANIKVQPKDCDEEGIWCMQTVTIVYKTYPWPPRYQITYEFQAHYIEGDECDITSYTATAVNNWVDPPVVLAQQTFTGVPSATTMHQMTFTLTQAQYNAIPSLELSFRSNCTLACSTYVNLGGEMPRPERNAEVVFEDTQYLLVQPNPAFEQIQVKYSLPTKADQSGLSRLVIVNELGQTAFELPLNATTGVESINVSQLPTGVYGIGLMHDNSVQEMQKLVIQR